MKEFNRRFTWQEREEADEGRTYVVAEGMADNVEPSTIRAWLLTALTTYGDARDAAARAEESKAIEKRIRALASFTDRPNTLDRDEVLAALTPTNPHNTQV